MATETQEKKYWLGLEQLHQDSEFIKSAQDEFAEELPIGEGLAQASEALALSRRDFLKLAGFSLSAASLAACTKMPVQKAMPYLTQPEDVVPGVANYYASTCGGCSAGCAIVVKNREGRPIKIEGNAGSSLNGAGVCAVGQASLLGLYDTARAKNPTIDGQKVSWADLDSKILAAIEQSKSQSKKSVLLTGTILSPTTKRVIDLFVSKYNIEHISYDAVSSAAIAKANLQSFGREVIPHYLFEKALTIVSVGADFLGTWLSPVEFSRAYAANRKLVGREAKLSYHVQFEASMSLAGSNADQRVAVAASDYGLLLLDLYNHIVKVKGGTPKSSAQLSTVTPEVLQKTAEQLWKNRGASLVVSNSQSIDEQTLVNAINDLLENIGKTIDLDRPSQQAQGDETKVAKLLTEMQADQVGTLIIWGVNPVYNYAKASEFANALQKVTTRVAISSTLDETASLCQLLAPDHHFLEAWNDAEPVKGSFSIAQPAIVPVFDTRSAQDSLLKWAGETQDFYHLLQSQWKNSIYSGQNEYNSSDRFWIESLKKGVVEYRKDNPSSYGFRGDLNAVWSRVAAKAPLGDQLELVTYQKVGIRDGAHANNPWLQELPDPVSKVAWDNYAAISPKLAKKMGVANENVVLLNVNGVKVELPVLVQPGQSANTVAVALGYGRSKAGKVGNGVGQNIFSVTGHNADGLTANVVTGVTLSKTDRNFSLAATQIHHTLDGRPIVKEMTFEEYQKDDVQGEKREPVHTLFPARQDSNIDQARGHAWGMVIDLNACTGCGSCVIACQVENNVAVVGKDEVRRRREMHWMRIDRYYSDTEENPEVVYQPMLCQHCGNAPCENVCPVIATNHSADGLNTQAYNRCVGTRYCANNCPYKVRRFNWFRYFDNEKFPFTMQDPLAKMVLNPDIVVRQRGVMEKCSMCVQRIQSGRLDAKLQNRPLADGDIKVACEQSCPTQAITFGDTNNANTRVSKLKQDARNYLVLDELNTRPIVSYLTKVRNKA